MGEYSMYGIENSEGELRFFIIAKDFNRAKEIATENGKEGEIYDRGWCIGPLANTYNEGEKIQVKI